MSKSPRRGNIGKHSPTVNPGPLVAKVRALLSADNLKEYPVIEEKPKPIRGPFAGLPDDYFATDEDRARERIEAGHPPDHLPPFPYLTWMERARKLTEMDVRSPGFDVKLTLFVPLLRMAAASQRDRLLEDHREEVPEVTRQTLKETVLALRAIEQCVLEHEEERRVGSLKGQTAKERSALEKTFRKIVSQLVARMLSILSTTAAPRLVLNKTPPPSTNPKELFPSSGTRTMRSTRVCHEAWNFLLVTCGMKSSRIFPAYTPGKMRGKSDGGGNGGDSESFLALSNAMALSREKGSGHQELAKKKKKKKPTRKQIKRSAASPISGGAIVPSESSAPRAPTSPRNTSSGILATPGDITSRSDFDYFGGASISSLQTPIYPQHKKSGSTGRGVYVENSDNPAQAQRIAELEAKLQESHALSMRLKSQQRLIDASPESAALALDARRLMMAEARTHQLRRQADTLLRALEGQALVVDHAERILLELMDMGTKGLLPNKRATDRGESVAQRVENLLERLRASARAAARARAEKLGD